MNVPETAVGIQNSGLTFRTVQPRISVPARECESGGIGRRAGLRSLWSLDHGGSIPPFRTRFAATHDRDDRRRNARSHRRSAKGVANGPADRPCRGFESSDSSAGVQGGGTEPASPSGGAGSADPIRTGEGRRAAARRYQEAGTLRSRWASHHPQALIRITKASFEFVYVATDDFTRLCFVDIPADERSETASSFLKCAVDWFTQQKVTVERVMTDNGFAFLAGQFRETCEALKVRHKRTARTRRERTAKPSASSRHCCGNGPTGSRTTPQRNERRVIIYLAFRESWPESAHLVISRRSPSREIRFP